MSGPSRAENSKEYVFAKGTEIDIMTKNLIECAYDREKETRSTMQQCLCNLGMKEPKLVLSSMLAFLVKNMKAKKVPKGHHVLLLNCMEKIISERDQCLVEEDGFVSDVVIECMEEMTLSASKEAEDLEWQQAASDVLVALSKRYCSLVVRELVTRLPNNTLPHFFVIETLGNVAQANPVDMAPHLDTIISQFLAYLPLAKLNDMRWVLAFSLGKFCDAVQEHISRTASTGSPTNSARAGEENATPATSDATDGDAPTATTSAPIPRSLSLSQCAVNVLYAFDIIFQHWLTSKELKVQVAVLDAIGSMVTIIESKAFEGYLARLLHGLMAQYKKCADLAAVSQCLAHVLEVAVRLCDISSPGTATPPPAPTPPGQSGGNASSGGAAAEVPVSSIAVLLQELDAILLCLFQQHSVKDPGGCSNPTDMVAAQRNQNEIKRCYAMLCQTCADRVLTFLFKNLDQNNEKSKLTALQLLRHLVIACDLPLRSRRHLVVSGVRTQLLAAPSSGLTNKVKMQMAHTIISMGGQGYLTLEGGHSLLEFILRQCALTADSDADKRRGGDAGADLVTNQQLRRTCENILRLSTNTVSGMHQVLWPRLLEFLVPVEYTEAVGAICENLVQLLTCKTSSGDVTTSTTGEFDASQNLVEANGETEFVVDYDAHVNIPRPQYLVARLIVLAGCPQKGNKRGLNVLRAMQLLAANFHENLQGIWNLVIPKLVNYLLASQTVDLNSDEDPPEFDQTQWEDLMLKMVAKSIEQVADEDWTVEFGEALGQHIVLYEKYHEEKSFLYKCIGTVLANAAKRDFIERLLDLVYLTARHSNPIEREGCALCYGLCAAGHLDTVLTKLELHTRGVSMTKTTEASLLAGTGNLTGVPPSAAPAVAAAPKRSSIFKFLSSSSSSSSAAAAASTPQDNRASVASTSSGVTPEISSAHHTSSTPTRLMSVFSGSGASAEKEAAKYTQLLAYGYTLLHSNPEYVTSRLESHVVKAIHSLTAANKAQKDGILRQTTIRCIELIGRSVSPERLQLVYEFPFRAEFLQMLWNFVKAEPVTEVHDETRKLCFQAAQTLVLLNPAFTDAEIRDLLNLLVASMFALPHDGIPVKKSKDLPVDAALQSEKLTNETVLQMNALLKEILVKTPTESCFTDMTRLLLPRVNSTHDDERLRALNSLHCLLNTFMENFENMICTNKRIQCFGQLLGTLVPRTADPLVDVRQISLDCMNVLLQLQTRLEGADEQSERMLSALPTLRDRLRRVDSNIMFNTVSDLGKVLVRRVPRGNQLMEGFLPALYSALKDPLPNGPAAACVVLNATFKSRASELTDHVSGILTLLHSELTSMPPPSATRTGTLRAVRTLASQHLVTSVNLVMSQSLPLDAVWCEMLATVMSADPQLHQLCINHVAEILTRVMPYEDREDPREKSVRLHMMTQAWLAAVNCLQVLCTAPNGEGEDVLRNVRDVVAKNYSRLISLWIVCIASSVRGHVMLGKSFEHKNSAEALLAVGVKPVKIAIDGLKNFLAVTQSHDIVEELTVSQSWDNMAQSFDDFLHSLGVLTKAICETQGGHVAAIVGHLVPYLSAIYDTQRIAVTAFFGSMLMQGNAHVTALVDTVLGHLQTKLADTSTEVRRLAVVGLGNAGLCGDQVVHKHCTALLSSLACGMDDRNDPEDRITHASMEALTSVLSKLTEPHVREVLASLCLKLLPCYEKDRASVRAAAFRLFGALSRFGVGPSQERFLQQANSLLVALLVHLNDEDMDVVRACKSTLKRVVPLMLVGRADTPTQDVLQHHLTGAPLEEVPACAAVLAQSRLYELLQNSLKEESGLQYGEFVYHVAKPLVAEFQEQANEFVVRCLSYFRSESWQIQCNAAILTGCLLQSFSPELRQHVQKEHVCMELIHLLKASDAKVRAKAAEAISLLHMY